MVVPQSPQGAVGDAQTGHHHHDGGDESLQLELENLSNEELVGVYQESNCIECLDILVRRNEGLLHHVIKRFAYSSEPYEDLFQVARIGLLKAAQRYDPTRADSFATYASALVDGEVRHHLRDNLLVRIPRWAKSIYVRIMRTQQEYFQREGRSPTIAEIAQETNIQEEGILEILRVYGATNLHSLDEPFADGLENLSPNRDLLRSLRQETFSLPIEDRITLYESVAKLSGMQRKLIYLLFFREFTQKEAGAELGMSQRNISRERTRALERLRALLKKKIF